MYTMILLVVWSAKQQYDGSALTSKTSSKVNLLNDDTYQYMKFQNNEEKVQKLATQYNHSQETIKSQVL